ALQDLRGKLEYDQRGFTAPSLHAWLDGRPGLLSLRAGEGHAEAPAHVFEGEIRAGLDAAGLLARAPRLDWLRPYLDGRSTWTVGVAVPEGGEAGGPAVLSLHSDLVGTALDLPPPLRKPAPVALPARVRIPLPLGEGDVHVLLGQRLSLRARAGEGE